MGRIGKAMENLESGRSCCHIVDSHYRCSPCDVMRLMFSHATS
ncbi:MAG: hypothetical protein OJF50_000774 [Nitrospira sp.]|nr:hypothetical protein [Nitrospira sp.]